MPTTIANGAMLTHMYQQLDKSAVQTLLKLNIHGTVYGHVYGCFAIDHERTHYLSAFNAFKTPIVSGNRRDPDLDSHCLFGCTFQQEINNIHTFD